jgi:hypothetical protein
MRYIELAQKYVWPKNVGLQLIFEKVKKIQINFFKILNCKIGIVKFGIFYKDF